MAELGEEVEGAEVEEEAEVEQGVEEDEVVVVEDNRLVKQKYAKGGVCQAALMSLSFRWMSS